MDAKLVAEQIFRASVESVVPSALIPRFLLLAGHKLIIGDNVFNLDETKNIYVIGAGKATALMAAEVEKILGDRITEGHISVKYGHGCDLKRIRITEAGHPVPDQSGYMATSGISAIAEKAADGDLVICLISGGGSALLPDVPDGSSADDVNRANEILVNSGADISEINIIRKHISSVKGGQLARIAYPARLITMVLSDVIGDPLDIIASGPTVPDTSYFSQTFEILHKYDLISKVPQSILTCLEEGRRGLRPETPKPSDPVFRNSSTFLIGTNRIALEAGKKKALSYDLCTEIVSDRLQGNVEEVARHIVQTALDFKKDNRQKKPVCLLFGGESTVKMTGKGLGGRNQHLVLLVSEMIREQEGITFLSCGTDGSDGPTVAAGAIIDSFTTKNAEMKNIFPKEYLREFDSFHFFERAGGHIITGPTMTNVMDIMVVIVE
jgi:glycerate-2-kinase